MKSLGTTWIAILLSITCGQILLADTSGLTRPEELSGWQMLFDGTSAEHWRNYQKEGLSDGWQVKEGELVRAERGAGDIITKEKYRYFELSLEYKISKGGNSGIMFHVTEDNPRPWHSGPEIQVQDNVDGHDPQLAGWLYQLYTPAGGPDNALDATRPVGQWNQIFLRISPVRCEVSMNGNLYYRFKLGDKTWKDRVAKSKFAKFEGFGAAGEGHICLQDHGNLVSYRNIKIRRLNEDGSSAQPNTGKLDLTPELAFPDLEWDEDGWEPIDENGKVRNLRIMELTYAPGDDSRLFAASQHGAIFTFENRPDVEESVLFLDLQDAVTKWYSRGANEEGLLGLALHPNYKENGHAYVYYSESRQDGHYSVVSRFSRSKDDPLVADPSSEERLIELKQPFQNHNGGSIEFGPDGMLYVSFGDGGLRNDPVLSGQDLSQLLGKIIRINVDQPSDSQLYSIPSDNPFVGRAGARGEIFALGLRNPWRIAFDKQSGRLWCGDVGQELWEEVNVIEKGANYGWSGREGSYAFGNKTQPENGIAPRDPVWEYDHSVGKSITGGRVYRSDRLSELQGKYLYADYVTGAIWALGYDEASGKATTNEVIVPGGATVMAFGEDPSGEIYYMVDSARGDCIYKFNR